MLAVLCCAQAIHMMSQEVLCGLPESTCDTARTSRSRHQVTNQYSTWASQPVLPAGRLL